MAAFPIITASGTNIFKSRRQKAENNKIVYGISFCSKSECVINKLYVYIYICCRKPSLKRNYMARLFIGQSFARAKQKLYISRIKCELNDIFFQKITHMRHAVLLNKANPTSKHARTINRIIFVAYAHI